MKTIIGITGGIASGKSLVSEYLINQGYTLIDCDKISHKITEINEEGYQAIIKHFGNNVINGDKTLNRKLLSSIIFNDEKERLILNSLIHPIVKKKVVQQIESSEEAIIFIDVPLLFESDFYKLCDYTIVIYVDYGTQVMRLKKRDNLDDVSAVKLIKAQMSLDEKKALADFVIDNNQTKDETYLQINKMIKQVEELKKCQEF